MQSRVVLRSRRLVSPAGIERSPFFVGNLLVSSSHTPATRPLGSAAISARWQSSQTSPSSEQAEAPEAPTADSDAAASHDAAAGSDGREQLRQRLYDQIIRVNQVRSAPHHMCLRCALHVVVLTMCGVVVCLSVCLYVPGRRVGSAADLRRAAVRHARHHRRAYPAGTLSLSSMCVH